MTPLGRSAATVSFGLEFDERSVTVDEAMAQATRSKDNLEIGDMETMTIVLDGLIRHNGTAKIELAEMPGRFIPAEIRDPRFNTDSDPYVVAFANRTPISVQARRGMKDGSVSKIFIMDTAP